MARPRGGDWLIDEMRALRESGADVIVSMLTRSEVQELDLHGEADAAAAAGLRFIALPTPDRGLPDSSRFRDLVADIADELHADRHVVVHCRMGIGRASLVAAAVLVCEGVSPDDAWNAIAEARGLAVPDTAEQRTWLVSFQGQMANDPLEPPFHRWGRVAEPANSRGAYLLIAEERSDGWTKPPPEDAIRVWHRRIGAPVDDDSDNWTVWLHRRQLQTWMANYVIEEWLPEGIEPQWSNP